ncbi:MAG: hypothetical protein ABR573_00420 [Candidatus Dormibacteria bacterium]
MIDLRHRDERRQNANVADTGGTPGTLAHLRASIEAFAKAEAPEAGSEMGHELAHLRPLIDRRRTQVLADCGSVRAVAVLGR